MVLLFTAISQNAPKHFGNARFVRNLFEAAVANQASRLAASGDFSATAMSRLDAPDLRTEVEPQIEKLRSTLKRFQINCSACGAIYLWNGEYALAEAECAMCKKTFNTEFGYAAFS